MNAQQSDVVGQNSAGTWTKRLSWMLPLLFLIKGLLWLVVPFLSAIYMLN